MLNHALMKTGMLNIWLDVLILAGYSLLLFYVSMRNIQRKWIL
jgi:hypothetical protein